MLGTMTAPHAEDALPQETLERSSGQPHVVVLDSDSGFTRVLAGRMDALGWTSTVLERSPGLTGLLGMRLTALLIDPEVLGETRWEFLEQLGCQAPEVLVIVCAAPSSVAERIRGLHLGADDWLAKPCHAGEVVARLQASLRRSRRATSRLLASASRAGELEVDNSRLQTFVSGSSIGLTRKEFELLRLLAGAPNKVLTREEIYLHVWGYRMAHGDRSVDVYIRKLRQKLERHSPAWTYIHTHLGAGYRFQAQPTTHRPTPERPPRFAQPARHPPKPPAGHR
jgi:DNA-binding response OmpR family regulator